MAVKRKVAGARVHSLMEELSATLMEDEARAKDAMESVFLQRAVIVAPVVLGWHGKSLGPKLDEAMTKIATVTGRGMAETYPIFQKLVEAAIDKGLASILLELQECEATMAKKYSGLSMRAVLAVEGSKEVLVSLAMVQYSNVNSVLPWVQGLIRNEMAFSGRQKEDPDVLLSRIISPVPVKLMQHSGRGLWWKLLEEGNRIAREVEFATVNAAREEAMLQFNKIGEKL